MALAWGYIVYVAQSNTDIGMSMGVAAGNMRSWSGVDFALMFIMWAVMMVAMMVPSAAPMILLFATVNRRRREESRPFVSTGVFLSGYIIVWGLFAAGAQKSSLLYISAIGTNLWVSLGLGWLYWQYGLIAAVAGHMLFHLAWYPLDLRYKNS